MNMQEITYEDLIQRLQKAVPEFRPDDEDISDHLVHLVFGDLTRYVMTLVEVESDSEILRRIFRLVEEAASSHDMRVRDALRDSFLEGLADSPNHLDKVQNCMGRNTLKLLEEAKRYLAG
jgi:hypothetical protein